MIIYCTDTRDYNIEDLDHLDITYDNYIYTNVGIYKKYKQHFYKLNLCHDVNYIKQNNVNFLLQPKDHIINKNDLLTSIPYHNFFVNRKTIKSNVDDNIIFVKEIDNDIYNSCYFITLQNDDETLNNICSFLKNKV